MHASSKVHARSIEFDKVAKSTPGTIPVMWLLQEMNAEAIDKLRILFGTAHAIAEHSRLFTDYVWLCNLGEKNGLNIGRTLYGWPIFFHGQPQNRTWLSSGQLKKFFKIEPCIRIYLAILVFSFLGCFWLIRFPGLDLHCSLLLYLLLIITAIR